MNRTRSLAVAALGGGVAILLPRMRREFAESGALTRSTAAAMWACYGTAAAAYAAALRRGRPVPPAATAAAVVAGASGLALTAAGMGAFDSVGQVTGSATGSLTVDGVYRISRNPQYVGYVVAGTAGALGRRSPLAMLLTAAYAAICAWWVRVEERALERTFGDEYRRFKSTTPRWLGRPRPRHPARTT